MSTILVTGASGFVGSWAVPALLDAGHDVVALVRGPGSAERVLGRVPAAWRSRIEPRTGDVTHPASLGAALEGVDGVLHLAAIPRDFKGGAELRLVNTEGTRAVVEAMHQAGVRRLVHMGALGVQDDPKLHYASSKAKGETIVAASSLDWTILKPSLQFGEGDGFFNVLAGLVRNNPVFVPVPGRGTSRFQPIHVGDVSRVIVRAFADPTTIGQAYDLGGPTYRTYREITAAVLAALGAKRTVVPVPVPLIALVAGAAEIVHLPFPVATDQLRQLRLDNVGPLELIRERFGFEPRDLDGGLRYLRRRPADQEPRGDALVGATPA